MSPLNPMSGIGVSNHECKTDGAIYELEFEPAGFMTPATVYARVFLPAPMNIAADPGFELKQRLHDALENALASLWEKRQ